MLAGLLVLISFLQLYQDRLYALLNVFALHALVLAMSVAWQAFIQDAPHLYVTAALALVQARAARYSDTAALFQSLGGGWWNRDGEGNLNPARRAVCKAPANPTAPQPWPDAQPLPDVAKPASKPSRSFLGWRFG